MCAINCVFVWMNQSFLFQYDELMIEFLCCAAVEVVRACSLL